MACRWECSSSDNAALSRFSSRPPPLSRTSTSGSALRCRPCRRADVRPRQGPGELAGGALIGLASVQFGIVVILGKLAQRSGLSVFAMLAVRFGIAAVLLAVLVAALRQTLVAARRERVWLVGLGFLGYAVESSLFFAALRHGEAAAVTLLFFTYPVFVSATSALIGRGLPRPLIAIALACALGGAALVVAFSGRLAIAPAGVLFALGSALSFTVYLLVLDHTVHRTDPLVTSMWVAG